MYALTDGLFLFLWNIWVVRELLLVLLFAEPYARIFVIPIGVDFVFSR